MGERITKFAKTVMVRRSLQLKKQLPSPEDVQRLTKHLTHQLSSIPLEVNNYFKIVHLAEMRLLLYNRQGLGETEVIR